MGFDQNIQSWDTGFQLHDMFLLSILNVMYTSSETKGEGNYVSLFPTKRSRPMFEGSQKHMPRIYISVSS
jgi:hypothetical protein